MFACLCACVIMWIEMQRAGKGMTSLVSVLKLPWYKEQFGMFFPPGFRVSRSYCLKHVFVLPHLPVFLPRMVLFEVVPEVRGRGMGWSWYSSPFFGECFFVGPLSKHLQQKTQYPKLRAKTIFQWRWFFPFWGQKGLFSGKNLLLASGRVYNLNRTGPTFG